MISLWGVNFHLYGLIIGVAVISALQVSITYARRQGIKGELVEKMAWWVIIGGLLGARVYHVAYLWKEIYRLDPVSALYVWQGGLGIWGGIMGGTIGLVLHTKVRNYLPLRCRPPKVPNLLSLMDVAVIGVPLGQAIGRLGNWVNGEIYGKNGEPLFAYEAVLNLILFSVLWRIAFTKKPSGKITGVYLVGYGLIRILLENLRPEEIIWKWRSVPVAVIMGTISILVGGVIWRRRRS